MSDTPSRRRRREAARKLRRLAERMRATADGHDDLATAGLLRHYADQVAAVAEHLTPTPEQP